MDLTRHNAQLTNSALTGTLEPPSTQLYLGDEVCGDGNDNDLDGDIDEGCGPDGDPDNDQILTVADNCPADHNPNVGPQQRRYWRHLSTSR